jgi:hypothetical protein
MTIINDKMPSFTRSLYNVLDDALREGARDTLINAKDKAPFSKGGLRSESEVKKNTNLSWRISFWIEYARFQEFGGDSKRRVRKYSHSGTGAHFLKNSGDEQATKMNMILRKHSQRARA